MSEAPVPAPDRPARRAAWSLLSLAIAPVFASCAVVSLLAVTLCAGRVWHTGHLLLQ